MKAEDLMTDFDVNGGWQSCIIRPKPRSITQFRPFLSTRKKVKTYDGKEYMVTLDWAMDKDGNVNELVPAVSVIELSEEE